MDACVRACVRACLCVCVCVCVCDSQQSFTHACIPANLCINVVAASVLGGSYMGGRRVSGPLSPCTPALWAIHQVGLIFMLLLKLIWDSIDIYCMSHPGTV